MCNTVALETEEIKLLCGFHENRKVFKYKYRMFAYIIGCDCVCQDICKKTVDVLNFIKQKMKIK